MLAKQSLSFCGYVIDLYKAMVYNIFVTAYILSV